MSSSRCTFRRSSLWSSIYTGRSTPRSFLRHSASKRRPARNSAYTRPLQDRATVDTPQFVYYRLEGSTAGLVQIQPEYALQRVATAGIENVAARMDPTARGS